MKHADPKALDRVEPLLRQLRKHESLREKSRGCFYRGGRGFLHFHEHGDNEMYADITLGSGDLRVPATSAVDRKALLSLVDKEIKRNPPGTNARKAGKARRASRLSA